MPGASACILELGRAAGDGLEQLGFLRHIHQRRSNQGANGLPGRQSSKSWVEPDHRGYSMVSANRQRIWLHHRRDVDDGSMGTFDAGHQSLSVGDWRIGL